jgi:hypothetical protein
MYDIFIMDMGGHDANVQTLAERFPHARVVRYYDNHLDTIRRCIARARTPWIWVVASCCDYTNFDFDYRAVPWESSQLHCWASGTEKFGDTFLINVDEFKKQWDIALLEWYKDVNWHRPGVPRLAWKTVDYTSDNLITEIQNTQFDTPYVSFVPSYHASSLDYDPPLWRQKMRNIVSFSSGNSMVLVPKDAQSFIEVQVYDYPHIDKQNILKDPAQDIIFISYDEPNADANWKILSDKFPQARRLHGIKGMENALLKAAEMSRTDWYYAVFAKTELHENFKFDYSPDYFQIPKHYIFYSKNRVNDLVYGEMAVILYNRNLIIDNHGKEFGLDYTLSFPHEVVPIISTYGNFDTSAYQTWRTAFREVSKLYHIQDHTPTIETEYRIEIWETVAKGPFAQWALNGAKDGKEFYLKYKDDFAYRKNSFSWQWLQEYFVSIYGEVK